MIKKVLLSLIAIPVFYGLMLLYTDSTGAQKPAWAGTGGGPGKMDVCHRTNGANAFVHINISEAAHDAHMAHGDVMPGDPAPEMEGMVLGENCEPEAEPTPVPTPVTPPDIT